MKFEDTKLPQTEKVRKAYDFFLNKLDTHKGTYKSAVIRDVHAQIDEQITALSMQSQTQQAENLEKKRSAFIQQTMPQVEAVADKWYAQNIKVAIKAAESLSVVSDKDLRDTLVSVALVSGVSATMMDFKDVENQLDPEVSEMLALFNENLKRPGEIAQRMRRASSEQKIFTLMDMATQLEGKKDLVETQPLPANHPLLQVNMRLMREAVENAKICYGLDEKADEQFVKSFNNLNKLFETGLSVEDTSGVLKLNVTGNKLGYVMIKSPVNPKGPGGKNAPPTGGKKPDVDETGKIKGPKPKW